MRIKNIHNHKHQSSEKAQPIHEVQWMSFRWLLRFLVREFDRLDPHAHH